MIDNQPTYHGHALPELQGNPLAEVLASLPNEAKEKTRLLLRKPAFNPNEVELQAADRRMLTDRLKRFMYPMGKHLEILSDVHSSILNGYSKRNPMTPQGQKSLYGATTPSSIMFLTGLSGIGKSALIRSIMKAIGNESIRHTEYNGIPFPETQLLYIMQNVPDRCTPKTLCLRLAHQIDDLLSRNLCGASMSRNHTQEDYIRSLQKSLRNYHVGAVVIDEFQNILLGRGANREELLAMITNFREDLGVPIILVGTPNAKRLLMDNASVARRLCDGGFYELSPPDSAANDEWQIFCKIIWGLQWVKNPAPLTDEIKDVLFEKSQGITGILLTLFINAQNKAIGGSESVDAALLRKVFDEQMVPLHKALNALRSKDPRLLRQFDDLYMSSACYIDDIADSRFIEIQKAASVPSAPLQTANAVQLPRKSNLPRISGDQLLDAVTTVHQDEVDMFDGILKG